MFSSSITMSYFLLIRTLPTFLGMTGFCYDSLFTSLGGTNQDIPIISFFCMQLNMVVLVYLTVMESLDILLLASSKKTWPRFWSKKKRFYLIRLLLCLQVLHGIGGSILAIHEISHVFVSIRCLREESTRSVLAKSWQLTFGKMLTNFQRFLNKNLSFENGAKDCIV